MTTSPASFRGMRGVNVRNTFLEFNEDDGEFDEVDIKNGFLRQASEPAKLSSWERQISASEPAKLSSWERQISDQTTTGTMDMEDDDDLLGHKPGDMLSSAASLARSNAALFDALQAMKSVQQMPMPLASLLPELGPERPQPAAVPRVPRFCPSCGAKVTNTVHRFCAYCCYPLAQLQQEAAAAQAAQEAAAAAQAFPPAFPGCPPFSGAPGLQSLAANEAKSLQPGLINSAIKFGNKATNFTHSQRSNSQVDFLSSLNNFRFLEADPLDVELAKALCLTHLDEEK